MINLQELQNATIDLIWTDGKLLKLNQPTISMYQKIEQCDNDLDKLKDTLVIILNNNTSARKFTIEDVNNLSKSSFQGLIKAISSFKNEVDQNPNA